MSEKEPQGGGPVPQTYQVQIHFIKSNAFRVVHATGAWFGGDPDNNIHLTFYNERVPIPQSVILELTPGSKVMKEASREGKSDFVREMEVDIVLTMEAAEQFYELLGTNLKAARQRGHV